MKNPFIFFSRKWTQIRFSKILDDILPGAGKAVQITNDGSIQMVNCYYLEIGCQIRVSFSRSINLTK